MSKALDWSDENSTKSLFHIRTEGNPDNTDFVKSNVVGNADLTDCKGGLHTPW